MLLQRRRRQPVLGSAQRGSGPYGPEPRVVRLHPVRRASWHLSARDTGDMTCDLVTLTELPDRVRTEIAARTGPVRHVETIAAGRNSPLSVRITADRGRWFVKGLPDDARRVATQEREYEISRHLRGAGPAARWQVRSTGWHVVGFDCVDGRHANYRPGSPDLPLVADLLTRLSATPAPDNIPLRHAEQRLAEHAPTDARTHFAGNWLVHSDLHPENVLVNDAASVAYLVDWGWATRGAAWLDAAYWMIWLIAAGHSPSSAEATAAQVPALRAASPEAVSAFAEANADLWGAIGADNPDPWRQQVSAAAHAWAGYRRAI